MNDLLRWVLFGTQDPRYDTIKPGLEAAVQRAKEMEGVGLKKTVYPKRKTVQFMRRRKAV